MTDFFTFKTLFLVFKNARPKQAAHEKHSPFAATQFLHTTGMPKWACVFTNEKHIPMV